MDKFKTKKNRKSQRLANYDYSQNGLYFVTICTKDREELFGEIKKGIMILNGSGEITKNNLISISNYFENIFLAEFVIMPNHIHAIIEINQNIVGVRFIEPRGNPITIDFDTSGSNESGLDESGCIAPGFDNPNTPGFDESNPYKKKIKNNLMIIDEITLGKIIRHFKAKSTNEIRKQLNPITFSWQRNYYDHIIRNDESLNKIREYIIKNPQMWERDRNNVENVWM
jgi:REP element-mobilizing transposase RayT